MTQRPRDPLLTAARLVITLILTILVAIGAGLLLGIPAVLALESTILADIARHSGKAMGHDVTTAICAAMAVLAVMAGIAFLFLVLLRRMIDSVALGDSFAPINAARLTQMGWLTVALQVLSIPAATITGWIDWTVRGGGRPEVGIAGLGGILTALLLFILARVFREGARMREDLEGTV